MYLSLYMVCLNIYLLIYMVCQACLPQQGDFNGLHVIYMNQKAVSDLLLFLWSELQQATYRQTRGHHLGWARCCELE